MSAVLLALGLALALWRRPALAALTLGAWVGSLH